jgi:hypothetical protein
VLGLVPAFAAAAILLRLRGATTAQVALTNPLQVSVARTFGLPLTVPFIAVAGLRDRLGDGGAYAVTALAGLAWGARGRDRDGALDARGLKRTVPDLALGAGP